MPVAFKEWAVTVRALAEGEQLVTLRKGGIREENRHFEIEHDRFFLYPTFDHQRNDLFARSHQPELGRALEEGVWPDGRAAGQGADPATAASSQPERVRIRAWAEVAASYLITDPRASTHSRRTTCGRPTTRRSASMEAPPSAPRDRAAHLPHPASGDRQGAAGVPRLPLVDRTVPRPAVRGHAGAVGRRVRARPRRRSRRSPRTPCRCSPSADSTSRRPGEARPGPQLAADLRERAHPPPRTDQQPLVGVARRHQQPAAVRRPGDAVHAAEPVEEAARRRRTPAVRRGPSCRPPATVTAARRPSGWSASARAGQPPAEHPSPAAVVDAQAARRKRDQPPPVARPGERDRALRDSACPHARRLSRRPPSRSGRPPSCS